MRWILLFLSLVSIGFSLMAQPLMNEHRAEIWASYVFPVKLSHRYAVWNDVQFVPKSFFISRHGFTYSTKEGIEFTAGYAWVKSTTPFSEKLLRSEHRPWGQIEFIQTLTPKIDFRFRLRYDLRIRKRIGETDVFDDFIHYSRIRFLNGIKFPVLNLKNEKIIYLNLLNETLLNFGREITGNNLDQNRVWVLCSYTINKVTIMSGYELRFIPGLQNNLIYQGGAIFIIHDIDFLIRKQ
jgi:hypothetical protein